MGFASDGPGAPELVFAIFVSCLYLEHSCCLRPTVFLLGSYVSRVVEAGPFFNHVEEKIERIIELWLVPKAFRFKRKYDTSL